MKTLAQQLSDSLKYRQAFYAAKAADKAVREDKAELIDPSRTRPLYKFVDGSYLSIDMTAGDYTTNCSRQGGAG